jgi:hypothetical protein
MRLLGSRGSVVSVRILLSFRVEGFGFGVFCVGYLAMKMDRLVGLVLPPFHACTMSNLAHIYILTSLLQCGKGTTYEASLCKEQRVSMETV